MKNRRGIEFKDRMCDNRTISGIGNFFSPLLPKDGAWGVHPLVHRGWHPIIKKRNR